MGGRMRQGGSGCRMRGRGEEEGAGGSKGV